MTKVKFHQKAGGAAEIPEKIIKELKHIRNAEGYLLAGSRVLGKASKNSDWDFFVLLKNGMPPWRKTWLVNNDWLEVLCGDESQVKEEYFEGGLKEGRGANLMMFATGEIIKDNKKGTLRKLQTQAKKFWKRGPAKLSRQNRQLIDYRIATAIQDVEDLLHDNKPEILLINNTVNDCVKYYYRLKGVWLPRWKERFHDFARREKKMAKLVKQINEADNWQKKARTTIQLGKQIGKRFKLSLDGCIHLPPAKSSN